ncbi:MAG: tyrosine-type recombinase/integrase [Bacillota bacterium]|nr:tyrosine-type recombinase/integrase [Bacillota bacterium]
MKVRVENFVEYLHSNKLSHNTIISYERDIREFSKFLRSKDIDDYREIEQVHISDFIEQMTFKGERDSTIYRKSTTIKKFFSFLLKNNLITYNPTLEIKRPKVKRELPDCISREEFDLIISEIDKKSFVGKRDYLIFESLFGTGIKVSELINVNVDDIDLTTSELVVDNNSVRNIPLKKELLEIISDYFINIRSSFIKYPTDALFLNYKGDRISRQGIWKIIKKYSNRSQIDREINPHTLRNSYAIYLFKSGKKPEQVRKIMGYNHIISSRYFSCCTNKVQRKEKNNEKNYFSNYR